MIADFLAGVISSAAAVLIFLTLMSPLLEKIFNSMQGGMGGSFITNLIKYFVIFSIIVGLPVAGLIFATINGYINYNQISSIVSQILPIQEKRMPTKPIPKRQRLNNLNP